MKVTGYQSLDIWNGVMSLPPHPAPPPLHPTLPWSYRLMLWNSPIYLSQEINLSTSSLSIKKWMDTTLHATTLYTEAKKLLVQRINKSWYDWRNSLPYFIIFRSPGLKDGHSPKVRISHCLQNKNSGNCPFLTLVPLLVCSLFSNLKHTPEHWRELTPLCPRHENAPEIYASTEYLIPFSMTTGRSNKTSNLQ